MTLTREIPLGNPMEWTVVFEDVNGIPFDPASSIRVLIVDPKGIQVNYVYPTTLSKTGVGIYSVTIVGNVSGEWVGKGTGLLPDGTPITTEDVMQTVGRTQVIS